MGSPWDEYTYSHCLGAAGRLESQTLPGQTNSYGNSRCAFIPSPAYLPTCEVARPSWSGVLV